MKFPAVIWPAYGRIFRIERKGDELLVALLSIDISEDAPASATKAAQVSGILATCQPAVAALIVQRAMKHMVTHEH